MQRTPRTSRKPPTPPVESAPERPPLPVARLLGIGLLALVAVFVPTRFLIHTNRYGFEKDPRPSGPVTPIASSDPYPDGVAPWEANPRNTTSVPDHTLPAWIVKPPRPGDFHEPQRLPTHEPANPATHRPPDQNPGGVNGDRPERTGAGLPQYDERAP